MKRRKLIKPFPCAKCGYDRVCRTDRVYLGDYGYLIKCPKCKSKSRIGFTVDEAVISWNEENQNKENAS